MLFCLLLAGPGEEQPFTPSKPLGWMAKQRPISMSMRRAHQVAALQRQQSAGLTIWVVIHTAVGVAFAMAQQLLRRRKIGCLVILDATAPGRVRSMMKSSCYLLCTHALRKNSGYPATFQRAALESLTRHARLEWLKTTLEAASALPPGSTMEDIQGLFNVFRLTAKVNTIRQNLSACRSISFWQPKQIRPVKRQKLLVGSAMGRDGLSYTWNTPGYVVSTPGTNMAQT